LWNVSVELVEELQPPLLGVAVHPMCARRAAVPAAIPSTGPTQCRANVKAHDRWRVPSRSSLVVHSEADCVLSDALPQACQGAAAASDELP
jgi:hypothetical protein